MTQTKVVNTVLLIKPFWGIINYFCIHRVYRQQYLFMYYSSGDDELNREGCISVDKLRTDEYLTLKIKLNTLFFFSLWRFQCVLSFFSPHLFGYLYSSCNSPSAFLNFTKLQHYVRKIETRSITKITLTRDFQKNEDTVKT